MVTKKMVASLSALILLAGCGTAGSATAPAESAAAEAPTSVVPVLDELVYYVEGTTSDGASVTMSMSDGTQQVDVDLPMVNQAGNEGVRMTGASIPRFAYVSAQNRGKFGSVTCRIELNGVVLAENTSSGAYKIATCKAS